MNYDTYESFRQLQRSGLMKFKPNTPIQVLLQIRKMQILKYSLDKINMKLKTGHADSTHKDNGNKEYEMTQNEMNLKLIHVFSFVECVPLEQIKFFKDICNSALLITFASVKFHQLEYLDLNSCNLGSIEFLTFLDLPQLKRLSLNNNNLTNLNSFAKSTFPKLYWIELVENQIQDAKGLHRSHLGPKLGVLDVVEKSNRQNMDVFTYLSFWFFKLPFEFINYIRKRQTSFLFKKNHASQALKKYPDVTLR